MNHANLSGKMGYLIVIMLAVLVLAALFLPQVRQLWLNVRAERVEISRRTPRPHRVTAAKPFP